MTCNMYKTLTLRFFECQYHLLNFLKFVLYLFNAMKHIVFFIIIQNIMLAIEFTFPITFLLEKADNWKRYKSVQIHRGMYQFIDLKFFVLFFVYFRFCFLGFFCAHILETNIQKNQLKTIKIFLINGNSMIHIVICFELLKTSICINEMLYYACS